MQRRNDPGPLRLRLPRSVRIPEKKYETHRQCPGVLMLSIKSHPSDVEECACRIRAVLRVEWEGKNRPADEGSDGRVYRCLGVKIC